MTCSNTRLPKSLLGRRRRPAPPRCCQQKPTQSLLPGDLVDVPATQPMTAGICQRSILHGVRRKFGSARTKFCAACACRKTVASLRCHAVGIADHLPTHDLDDVSKNLAATRPTCRTRWGRACGPSDWRGATANLVGPEKYALGCEVSSLAPQGPASGPRDPTREVRSRLQWH